MTKLAVDSPSELLDIRLSNLSHLPPARVVEYVVIVVVLCFLEHPSSLSFDVPFFL